MKHLIIALFIFLTSWNCVLMGASGVLMCANAEGQIYDPEFEFEADCCHSPDKGTLSGCGNCLDVELDGIDFLATRDPGISLPECVPVNNYSGRETVYPRQFVEETSLNPGCAPPDRKNTSVKVAETTVLRL